MLGAGGVAGGAAVAGTADVNVLQRYARVPVVAAGAAEVLALVVHVLLVLAELVGTAEGARAVAAVVNTAVKMCGMHVAPQYILTLVCAGTKRALPWPFYPMLGARVAHKGVLAGEGALAFKAGMSGGVWGHSVYIRCPQGRAMSTLTFTRTSANGDIVSVTKSIGEGESVPIGRKLLDSILEGDLSVSDEHAEITLEGSGKLRVKALSKNGTFIDGKKVGNSRRAALPHACKLTFGDRVVDFLATIAMSDTLALNAALALQSPGTNNHLVVRYNQSAARMALLLLDDYIVAEAKYSSLYTGKGSSWLDGIGAPVLYGPYSTQPLLLFMTGSRIKDYAALGAFQESGGYLEENALKQKLDPMYYNLDGRVKYKNTAVLKEHFARETQRPVSAGAKCYAVTPHGLLSSLQKKRRSRYMAAETDSGVLSITDFVNRFVKDLRGVPATSAPAIAEFIVESYYQPLLDAFGETKQSQGTEALHLNTQQYMCNYLAGTDLQTGKMCEFLAGQLHRVAVAAAFLDNAFVFDDESKDRPQFESAARGMEIAVCGYCLPSEFESTPAVVGALGEVVAHFLLSAIGCASSPAYNIAGLCEKQPNAYQRVKFGLGFIDSYLAQHTVTSTDGRLHFQPKVFVDHCPFACGFSYEARVKRGDRIRLAVKLSSQSFSAAEHYLDGTEKGVLSYTWRSDALDAFGLSVEGTDLEKSAFPDPGGFLATIHRPFNGGLLSTMATLSVGDTWRFKF